MIDNINQYRLRTVITWNKLNIFHIFILFQVYVVKWVIFYYFYTLTVCDVQMIYISI